MSKGKRGALGLLGAILAMYGCGSGSDGSGASGANTSGSDVSGSGASGSGAGSSSGSGSGAATTGSSASGSGVSGTSTSGSSVSGSGTPDASSSGASSGSSGTSGSGAPVDAGSAKEGGGTFVADASSPKGGADAASEALIQNDVFWKDTSGNLLYSQGGGVIQVGNTFYWYGVQYGGAATYAANPTGLNSDTSFVAVTCYSSTDLANWKFENNVLTTASIEATGWVGRVGAAYNPTTKNYVLVMQYTGTHGSGELFATSPTPTGAFTFNNVQATLTNVVNNGSGDQSVFTDDVDRAVAISQAVDEQEQPQPTPLRP